MLALIFEILKAIGLILLIIKILVGVLRLLKSMNKRHTWHRRARGLVNFVQRNLRRFKSDYDHRLEDWYRKIERRQ